MSIACGPGRAFRRLLDLVSNLSCFELEAWVPTTAESGRLWLPFEGDRMLSIILSKAMLLAADEKITDPVIPRQL